MNHEQINLLIATSLSMIHTRDSLLLERNVREECINHRLAFYFETIFESIIHDEMFYEVDLEYNKNLSIQDKDIESEKNIRIHIRPDVIIHNRKDNAHNLLAVEAKLNFFTFHDKLKIVKLLYAPYEYRYTVGIIYYPNRDYFRYSLYYLNNHEVILESITISKNQNL
jgi:hypothetical protein